MDHPPMDKRNQLFEPEKALHDEATLNRMIRYFKMFSYKKNKVQHTGVTEESIPIPV